MDNDIEKQIQSRFEDLPEDVQHAIQSEEVEKKLHDIGQKFQLHIDQIGKLGDETRMVMLGFVDPADFAKGISEQLNMDPAKAEQLAEDISSQIFVGIRDSMQDYIEQRLLQEEILKNGGTADKGPAAIASAPQPDKSVVMPSAAKPLAPATAAPVPAPTIAPLATPKTELTAPVKPPELPAMGHIDDMLSQPTVSVAPKAPAPAPTDAPKPVDATQTPPPNASPIYKSDPYHEPID